jgi:DNA-binding MarR family transcriptional regulator
MSANSHLSLNGHLCFSIYATSIAINRLYKPILDKLEITYPQYLVLTTIWEADELTISDIGDNLALNPSTISPLVKRLEQAGFLKRHRNAENERQVMVNLTPKGIKLLDKAQCLTETLLESSDLTVKQMIAMNDQILKLREAVAKSTVVNSDSTIK